MNHDGYPIDLNPDTNIVFFFSPKDVTEVLIHHGEWFYVYEITFNEETNAPDLTLRERRQDKWIDKSIAEKF